MIDSEYQLIEELTSSSRAPRGYRGKRRRGEKKEKQLPLPYIETIRGSEYLAWYEYYGRPRRVVHNSDIERSLDRHFFGNGVCKRPAPGREGCSEEHVQ
jgi:hypothetical protein